MIMDGPENAGHHSFSKSFVTGSTAAVEWIENVDKSRSTPTGQRLSQAGNTLLYQ
jgi:hypothetical protein